MINIDPYSIISLEEMNEVRLMNRVDRKFCFNRVDLQEILDTVSDDYYMLHIDTEHMLHYSTIYFDTSANDMFNAHHNGKLNRYKVRKRKYDISGKSFLEVKFKNNKGRTIKNRIPSDFSTGRFNNGEFGFISYYTPYNPDELVPSLRNSFKRITLVNKNFKERVTIDMDLNFICACGYLILDDLIITEVKAEGNSERSSFLLALRDYRHKPSGFSKYAIGRSITDSSLKRNAFKEKIRRLEKILLTNMNLF